MRTVQCACGKTYSVPDDEARPATCKACGAAVETAPRGLRASAGPAAAREPAERLELIEAEVERLRASASRSRLLAIASAAAAGLALVVGLGRPGGASPGSPGSAAADPVPAAGSLTVRRLVVADDDGRPAIVLEADGTGGAVALHDRGGHARARLEPTRLHLGGPGEADGQVELKTFGGGEGGRLLIHGREPDIAIIQLGVEKADRAFLRATGPGGDWSTAFDDEGRLPVPGYR